MEVIVRYKCVCGKIFESKDDCVLCEVGHYPLSLADYNLWQSLQNYYNISKDDESAHALTIFERYHHLPLTIKE